jgi:DsbC/DsbD-like thiol-disulfide interchange protein
MLLPCLVTLGTANNAHAQGKKSDAVVKVKAEAGKPNADGTTPVQIHLTIDKGWHVYANPTGSEDLADTATTVTSGGNAKVEGVEYPAGKVVHDKTLGDYKVYEDKVTITAKVRRGAGGGPIDLALKIQACSDQKCLVPATIKVPVP